MEVPENTRLHLDCGPEHEKLGEPPTLYHVVSLPPTMTHRDAI